jgi:hypothetical protein
MLASHSIAIFAHQVVLSLTPPVVSDRLCEWVNTSGKFTAGPASDGILQVPLSNPASTLAICPLGFICAVLSSSIYITPSQLADGSVRLLDSFGHFTDMPASSAECAKQAV